MGTVNFPATQASSVSPSATQTPAASCSQKSPWHYLVLRGLWQGRGWLGRWGLGKDCTSKAAELLEAKGKPRFQCHSPISPQIWMENMRFQSPVWVSVLSPWQGFLQILCLPNKPGCKLRLGRVFPLHTDNPEPPRSRDCKCTDSSFPRCAHHGWGSLLEPPLGLPDSGLSFHHPRPPGVLSRGYGAGTQVLWAWASREAVGARMGPRSSNPDPHLPCIQPH